MIQALHAQYPDITQLIPATFKTNGYRRNAMASIGCSVADERRQHRASGRAGRDAGRLRDAFGVQHARAARRSQAARAVVLNTWDSGRTTATRPRTGTGHVPAAQPGRAELAALGERHRPRHHGQPRDRRDGRAEQHDRPGHRGDQRQSRCLGARLGRDATAATRAPATASHSRRPLVHLSDFLWAPQVGRRERRSRATRSRVSRTSSTSCGSARSATARRPGFFVYAQEHAREWVGPLVALETANRLLKNYGTDPQTTSYVDNLDIFIDPSVNTDGGNYSMLQGGGVRPAPHDDPLLRAEQPGRRGG